MAARQQERRIFGQSPAVLWAVWENVLSWFVRSYFPSFLPRLVPSCPYEEDVSSGDELANSGSGDQVSVLGKQHQTRCILIGRPGGMEQLRLVALQRDKFHEQKFVTCGYNLQSSSGPIVNAAASEAKDDLPDPDCVILENHAFSVNYADCCIRWGLYESAKQYVGYPICPGFDVAGVVEQVGSQVTSLKAGDRAFGCSLFGAYSSRVMVPALHLRRIPTMASDSSPSSQRVLSMTEAAAVPAVALTALYALLLAGHYPTPNKFRNKAILIHSAAGGVGSMLVQMSRLLNLGPSGGNCGTLVKDQSRQRFRVSRCH